MRLNSRTACVLTKLDRSLHSGLKAPELVIDAGHRDNRWTASLYTWPSGCSPLVLPPSQEVGSAWASLSLDGCSLVDTQVKACSGESHSPSRASKTNGHHAFQIIPIHTPLLSTVVAHTLLNTAHTVAPTAATILADAAVTPPSQKWPKMCRWDVKPCVIQSTMRECPPTLSIRHVLYTGTLQWHFIRLNPRSCNASKHLSSFS